MAQAGGRAEGDNGEQEQQTQQQSSAEVRWRGPDYYVAAFELLERGVEVNLLLGRAESAGLFAKLQVGKNAWRGLLWEGEACGAPAHRYQSGSESAQPEKNQSNGHGRESAA